MARGQQKIQSQQKNAKKQAEKKKHGSDQKAAAKAALVFTCPVCRVRARDRCGVANPGGELTLLHRCQTQKRFKQHFESKHPKSPMPPELVDVQA
ncbi:unnamed protein product [Ranitomeya imitator]|uniref:Small EDRK-rich factor-like N-terminal domain-containing protein n=1 Tax=Ranitomeya imitator TaxID=111125 RepID=A0ABN9LNV5_9NEOB|nr:unnamed protein product [Ranitomeya imitator]